MKSNRPPTSFDLPEEGTQTSETFKKQGSEKTAQKPETFDLADVQIIEEIDETLDFAPMDLHKRAKPKFAWGALFWTSLTTLLLLGLGLWVDGLIRGLFERYDWLGYVGLAVTVVFVSAVIAIISREIWALFRLSHLDTLRQFAIHAHERDDDKEALELQERLVKLYSSMPETAEGRAKLAAYQDEIIDGRNRIRLIERDLLKPLDLEAERLVMASAKRVALVTAVSPRALVDVLYVLMENIRLIRAIATLYSGRPGTIGTVRLFQNVLAHLAVTGAIAVGDGLLQQVIGHGMAARLSARFGEGVVNGLLTARIGLAAHDICRAVPFLETTRPSLSTYMSGLLRMGGLTKHDK